MRTSGKLFSLFTYNSEKSNDNQQTSTFVTQLNYESYIFWHDIPTLLMARMRVQQFKLLILLCVAETCGGGLSDEEMDRECYM